MESNNFYCLVVGSRAFNDFNLLKHNLDNILKDKENVVIVSGGAKGADYLAEQYAKENGLELKVFQANWNKYGKSAGYIRNDEMHKFIANFDNRICVAFWDGQSKGTAHSFKLSERYGTELKLIEY